MADHDRDQVVEQITAAFSEGRLNKGELDERLHLAMTARTHADLAPITRDLNTGPPVPQAPRLPHAPAPTLWPGEGHAGPRTGGERLAAAAGHILPLFGLSLIGPLIVLLCAGRTSSYVRRQAIEALNFHLTVVGATIVLPFTIIGVVLIPVIWIAAVVLGIAGAAAALGDGWFRYPFTLRLIK